MTREQHPALALILDEAPVGVGERERDHQENEDLEQVREAIRVLERMGGVGVVEAAAVLSQLLDRLLARNRATGDRLGDTLHRRGVGEAVEVLDDPLAPEQDRDDDGDRQQHPDRAAREIDPEVADRGGAAADEPPDQRNGDGQPDRGGEEVLDGEAGHLGEMAHRQLAAVVLPVRVGDEGGCRVEGQCRRHRLRVRWVERQVALHPLQEVEAEDRDEAERDQRKGVDGPRLLTRRVDAASAVDDPLDRQEDAVAERLAAAENAGDVGAEDARRDEQDRDQDAELEPAVRGHPSRSG